MVLQCINGVSSNPVEGRANIWTARRSNSNTVWFNFQTYIIYSINLVSQVTLRSSGTDIVYGCHLLRCLYNVHYFLLLYDEFFIILYNILKIAELDRCQIIILSIYVPSTQAYTHVLRLSLDICLTRQGNTTTIEAPFLGSGCSRVV